MLFSIKPGQEKWRKSVISASHLSEDSTHQPCHAQMKCPLQSPTPRPPSHFLIITLASQVFQAEEGALDG